jgi:hypothetical protein
MNIQFVSFYLTLKYDNSLNFIYLEITGKVCFKNFKNVFILINFRMKKSPKKNDFQQSFIIFKKIVKLSQEELIIETQNFKLL